LQSDDRVGQSHDFGAEVLNVTEHQWTLDDYYRRSVLRPGYLNRGRESGVGGKQAGQEKACAQTAPLRWHTRHDVSSPPSFQEADFSTNLLSKIECAKYGRCDAVATTTSLKAPQVAILMLATASCRRALAFHQCSDSVAHGDPAADTGRMPEHDPTHTDRMAIYMRACVAERAAHDDAVRVIKRWNAVLAAERGGELWSPTIRCAIVAGMPWLDVHCPGCGTSRAIDIRTIDRHPFASVGSLVLGLRCSWCYQQCELHLKSAV
jgi:hypothetical protein